MKKTLLFIIICGIFLVVVPLMVNAQTVEIPNPLDCDDAECIVDKIAIAIRPIAVAVAIVMIIISGIQYITSTGDEEKIKRAKKNNALYGYWFSNSYYGQLPDWYSRRNQSRSTRTISS